jgi:cardiolipin synthase
VKWLLLGAYLPSLALIPRILLANNRPAATIAWIWALILFPIIGPLAYFLVGDERIQRKRLRRRQEFRGGAKQPLVSDGETETLLNRADERTRDLLLLLARLGDIPVSSASEVELLIDASTFYPALLDSIASARHHIHVQFFVWQTDEYGVQFRDALVEAARRGVEVRLLLDEIGCWPLPRRFLKPLIDAGGKFSWCMTIDPTRNRYFFHLRNHRKLQVIDGTKAFVGGMNVGREYAGKDPALGRWRDVQVGLSGPVVSTLQSSFADDWYFATHEKLLKPSYYPETGNRGHRLVQIISGGPDSPHQPLQKSVIALLQHARKKVWISTGYFIPNELLLTALQLCGARGVEVRLLIAEKNDHPYLVRIGRSYYESLLEFGVRIFEYSHGIEHAKTLTIDGEWAMIGSANFDIRSMRLNFELNALVYDPATTRKLEESFSTDFDRSREIKLSSLRRRPLRDRLLESALRPLAPIL